MSKELGELRVGTGRVKSFNEQKGYGFISCKEVIDQDIYFHYSEILKDGLKTVKSGDYVKFLYKTYFEEQEVIDEKGNVKKELVDKGLRAYQVELDKEKVEK